MLFSLLLALQLVLVPLAQSGPAFAATGQFAAGGDAKNTALGGTIAASAYKNNYLNHDDRAQVEDLIKERAKLCQGGVGPGCRSNSRVVEIDERLGEFKQASNDNTTELIDTCGSGPSAACGQMLSEAKDFNEWTKDSWNFNYRDGLSTGGEVLNSKMEYSQYFDLDESVVKHYGRVQSGDIDADTAATNLAVDLAQYNGRIKMGVDGLEVAADFTPVVGTMKGAVECAGGHSFL